MLCDKVGLMNWRKVSTHVSLRSLRIPYQGGFRTQDYNHNVFKRRHLVVYGEIGQNTPLPHYPEF